MDKLVDRFKEGSSWAAIGAALALFGINIPEELYQHAAQVVGGLAMIIGFLLPDRGA